MPILKALNAAATTNLAPHWDGVSHRTGEYSGEVSNPWNQESAARKSFGKGADEVDPGSACAFCGEPLLRGHRITGETLCERHGQARAAIEAADYWGMNDAQVIAQQDLPNALEVLGACQELRRRYQNPPAPPAG